MKRIVLITLSLAFAAMTARGQNIVPKAPEAHWAYADSHKNVTYLDYFTPLANAENGFNPEQSADGIHPYATVYRQMEQMLNETVSKVLKTKNDYYVISEEDARKATDAKRAQWAEMMSRMRTQ